MQENLRFASSGDDVKIWDASSMTLVDSSTHTPHHMLSAQCVGAAIVSFKKNSHCVKHPVAVYVWHSCER